MKRRDLLSASLDAILAAVIAISGAGCLTTGLNLWTNMTAVVLTALAFAALAVVLCRLRKSWIWILVTLLLGLLLLWKLDFASSFYPQLKEALTYYHRGYGWGVPEWLSAYKPCNATLTACAIAAGAALLAGISLQKNRYVGALLALLLPVIPCIVVTDTPPDGLYLWLGFLCIGVLTLTWNSRRIDARQANRLTAMVLIPVMLASILLFSSNPQSEYDAPDREEGIFQMMSRLVERLPFMNMTPGHSSSVTTVTSPQEVDLTTAGPRDMAQTTAMEVRASYSGAIYLRGRSYDVYTGLQWMASAEVEVLPVPAEDYLNSQKHRIVIHTHALHAQQYIPYYLPEPMLLQQGMLTNNASVDFVYSVLPLRTDWKLLWHEKLGGLSVGAIGIYAHQLELSPYLQLPWSTEQQARNYLQQIGAADRNLPVLEAVERIRDYVRDSADYNLYTGYMPSDAQDFALWFLENGDTGYCVHFATAATVLLRAAGIPARYVEGYLVEAKAGQNVVVTSSNAHAWVEYYLPGVGWAVLEATPGDGLSVTFPPEPTLPPETEPTEPSLPTAPTVTTRPTEPTEPTEPETTAPTEPTEPETTAPTEPTPPPTSTGPATAPTEPALPPDTPAEPRDWSGLWKALGWIALGLAALAVVIGQWRLRLYLRWKKMQGSTWPQVRKRWRYACRLAKICGHTIPPALEDLAKKAKFSQHTLSNSELRQFDRYTDACIRTLRQKPWPMRVIYRLILAIW